MDRKLAPAGVALSVILWLYSIRPHPVVAVSLVVAARVKEVLIKSSFRRRPESRL